MIKHGMQLNPYYIFLRVKCSTLSQEAVFGSFVDLLPPLSSEDLVFVPFRQSLKFCTNNVM